MTARPKAVVFDVGETLLDETRVWSLWADRLGVSQMHVSRLLARCLDELRHRVEVAQNLA